MISFKITKKSKKSKARLGILKTPHGEVQTPAFVPVATLGAVKTLTFEAAKKTGAQLLISNTFHLHLRPGEQVVKKMGGLHKFTSWDRPLMTDSGGFQVFSLGFGGEHGMGKILKEKSGLKIQKGDQPKSIKIRENGVEFRSPIDGQKLFIGPKESIKIQEALGADIIYAFDECTSPVADYEYTKKSIETTHRWAKESLKYHKSKQAIYGVVQGGRFKDLRLESAKFIGSLPFNGFGIGGEFGDDKKAMSQMISWVVENLPEEKPRHLLGIGYLEDMIPAIKSGVDTFDCIVPTRFARHGVAFTRSGRLDLGKTKFLNDKNPLDKKCKCEVCKTHTRSYISHLFRAKEINAMELLTFHNLFYFNEYVGEIRNKIKRGEI